MKLKWKKFQLALAAMVASLGIGCGGLSASQSISPATFLLPGLGQNVEQPTTEEPGASPLVALNVPAVR